MVLCFCKQKDDDICSKINKMSIRSGKNIFKKINHKRIEELKKKTFTI